MTELLQFSLMDMTPYDRQSWFNLLAGYHRAIWPLHLLALPMLLVLSLLMMMHDKVGIKQTTVVRLALVLLGLSWLWCGGVFHLQYFSSLNWAAQWFGVLFMIQGGFLLLAAGLLRTVQWIGMPSWRGWFGVIVLLVALLVYPLSGLLEGRTLLQLEVFPLLPAPVMLITVAVLILLNSGFRHVLVIIPLLWGIISAAFAATLGLVEVYFMIGALAIWFVSMLR